MWMTCPLTFFSGPHLASYVELHWAFELFLFGVQLLNVDSSSVMGNHSHQWTVDLKPSPAKVVGRLDWDLLLKLWMLRPATTKAPIESNKLSFLVDYYKIKKGLPIFDMLQDQYGSPLLTCDLHKNF